LGYYLLGAAIIKIKLPRLRVLLFGLAFGISLSLINYYIRTVNNLPLPFFSFSYIFPGVVISSAAVFLIVKSLNKNLNSLNKQVKLLIISLSTASFGIFFIHGLITDYFSKILGRPYLFNVGFFGEWINSLTLFIISYLIILLLAKIPFVKKFIT